MTLDHFLAKLIDMNVASTNEFIACFRKNRTPPDDRNYAGLLDLIADFLGVPPDNTIEMNAMNYAYAHDGELPEGTFCRDWLYHLVNDYGEGEITIEQLLKELREAADDATAPSESPLDDPSTPCSS